MAVSLGGLSPEIAAIIQDNTLQKVFHDALFPGLLYRADAMPEIWDAHEGETKVMTRTGLLTVDTAPLVPGTDPTPETYGLEQWSVTANQYGKAVDTHMPSSRAALASKLIQDVKKLGLNAGQTMNRLARDPLFRAYSGGQTACTAVAAIGAFTMHVASMNGFNDRLLNGVVTAVSAAAPITISFPGIAEPDRLVVAAVPDAAAAPFGPGTLTISAALTVGCAARQPILASTAPEIYRVGGGTSVDAIGAADVLTLQDIINAVAILNDNNIPTHGDGNFHHHLGPKAVAQVFSDNAWQRLHESLPDSLAYRKLVIGQQAECLHFRNSESPDFRNTGTLISSGAGASEVVSSIGAEVTNNAGVHIGRTIITGESSLMECYIPEADYMTEAGATGKVGNFSVMNNGVFVDTARVRFTMRAPLDRLQQVVSNAWSWSGGFAVPSDQSTTGDRFARAIVIEHAIS